MNPSSRHMRLQGMRVPRENRLTVFALGLTFFVFIILSDLSYIDTSFQGGRFVLVGVALLVSLPLVYVYSGNFLKACSRAPLAYFCVFIFLGLVTAFFSENVSLSLTYALGYAAVVVFALVLVTVFSLRTLIAIFQFALALNILLSFLAHLLGLQDGYLYDQAWNIQRFGGLYGQPNPMGAASALYILIFLSSPKKGLVTMLLRPRTESVVAFFYVTAFPVSLWVLWQSHSRSALISLVVALIALLVMRMAQWLGSSKRERLAVGFIMLSLGALLFAPPALILSGTVDIRFREIGTEYIPKLARTGDPSEVLTLTGRTVLWSYLLQKVSDKPWIGYGMGSTQELLAEIIGRDATRSHNAYIEAAVFTGYLGGLLFTLSMASTLSRAMRFFSRSDETSKLVLGVTSFYCVLALVEPVIVGSPRTSLLVFLIVGAYLSLNREARGSKVYTTGARTRRVKPTVVTAV